MSPFQTESADPLKGAIPDATDRPAPVIITVFEVGERRCSVRLGIELFPRDDDRRDDDGEEEDVDFRLLLGLVDGCFAPSSVWFDLELLLVVSSGWTVIIGSWSCSQTLFASFSPLQPIIIDI